MKPAIVDEEEIAAQADIESNTEDKAESLKPPLSPFDAQGRDVFCGYSFRGAKDDDSVFGDDEMADDTLELQSTREEEMGDINEARSSPNTSISTRPTSVDASLGHLSKDASMASVNSDIHQRQQSSGLESLVEDSPLQPAIELVPTTIGLPAPAEEDEWAMVENEGSEEYTRKGRLMHGSTFFSRGIADKCTCPFPSLR